jgi:hypothetical protein
MELDKEIDSAFKYPMTEERKLFIEIGGLAVLAARGRSLTFQRTA